MPNRILKESICTSEDIDSLGWFAEVFYYRLLVNCDDYGRMDGRAAILKARLFPLRAEVSLEAMDEALAVLAARGCLRRYEVDGRGYVQVVAWASHQRVRMQREKYPPPPAADGGAAPPEAEAVSESVSECEAQSECEAEADSGGCALPAVAAAAADMGMAFARSDEATARVLAAEYTEAWVLEAMRRAAQGPSRTWRYIRGILKRWQEGGGMDDWVRPAGSGPGERPAKVVLAQQYTQREYTRAELEQLYTEV